MKYQLKPGIDREEMRREVIGLDKEPDMEPMYNLLKYDANEPIESEEEWWEFYYTKEDLQVIFWQGQWICDYGAQYTITLPDFITKYFEPCTTK